MHRCLVTKDWIDRFILNNGEPLPKDAARRFLSVIRIKSEEIVAVFDGAGREVRGSLISGKKETAFLEARLFTFEKQKPDVVVMQAAIDYQKFSETLKRGAEFGVDRFIVFDAKFSERFCFQKLQAKRERLARILEDASRQSGRDFIPTVHFAKNINSALGDFANLIGLGVFGEPNAKERFSEILLGHTFMDTDFLVVVGPEGGLHESECQALKNHGIIAVRWCPYILRTELASLAPVSIFHAYTGRA